MSLQELLTPPVIWFLIGLALMLLEIVATATANGIRRIASSIGDKNGIDAVNLRIAEQYLTEFGKLARENNTMIIPSDLADISGIIATATSVMNKTRQGKKE